MSTYPPQPPPPQQQTSSKAIIALVMAILAWTTCPIVLAIPALIFSGQAKREIDSSNGWVTGEGLVTASRIMAWLNIGLMGLFALVMLGFFAFAVAFGASSEMVEVTPNTVPDF